MNAIVNTKSQDIAEICRNHGVRRLEVFDPVAAEVSVANYSGPEPCEVGFVIEFEQDSIGLAHVGRMMKLEKALENLLQCRVGLKRRRAIENGRNPRRRERILSHLEAVYG